MTPTAVIELLRDLLTAEFAVDPGDVHPQAVLRDDLDLDSLDTTELLQRIEECASVEIEAFDLKDLRTLADVVDLVVRAAGRSPASERQAIAQG